MSSLPSVLARKVEILGLLDLLDLLDLLVAKEEAAAAVVVAAVAVSNRHRCK